MTAENIKKNKILICDDDKSVTYFLERFLKREGYEFIDHAASGEEAVEKVSKETYQIVFMDIKLPEMTGIEALKRIKEINEKTTVIMITGFPEIKTAEEAVKIGAYDYIVKPFDLAYLKMVVLTKVLSQ